MMMGNETRQQEAFNSGGYDDAGDDNVAASPHPEQEEEEVDESDVETDDEINIDDSEQQIVCSVLNTVVNHIMAPPSPLEREEYESGDPTVMVPVLRVFGPILRRDDLVESSNNNDILPEPNQSACLHIHNAFPYLLARPVDAGPDGALHGSVHKLSKANERAPDSLTPPEIHIDWDSVASVERIVPVLKETLEAAIQDFGNFDKTSNGEAPSAAVASPTKKPPVIRKITVVTGRGFYTYCPGPPAPFLRVEYYDPSCRWLVKRVLERGLPDLPDVYHPDPAQYDDSLLVSPSQQQPPKETLTFRCYEAHLSYTTQFFKDYNLAGMSYIHLSEQADVRRSTAPASAVVSEQGGVRFRQPLPSCRQQDHTNCDCYTFYECNTPDAYRWQKEDDNGSIVLSGGAARNQSAGSEVAGSASGTMLGSDSNVDLQQASWSSSPADPTPESTPAVSLPSWGASRQREQKRTVLSSLWKKKGTSCDIELDVSVSSILNVLQVMTELPDESSEHIYWRAVPSLAEIWQQERRRMAKLVPPREDFLSQAKPSAPPSLTLDVKKGAAKPGAQLAAEGMRRLVQVTDGLDENFRRSLQQITKRHAKAIDQVDRLLREERSGHESRASSDLILTPADDETMATLCALGAQFETDDEQEEEESSSGDEKVMRTSSLSRSQDDNVSSTPTSCPSSMNLTQSSERSQAALSQSYYDLNESDLGDDDTGDQAYELSQRVERGDGIVRNGAFAALEDFIDPATLAPYEDLGDDDDEAGDEDEDEVEQELGALATQTLESKGTTNDASHTSAVLHHEDESSVESIDLLAEHDAHDREPYQNQYDAPTPSSSSLDPSQPPESGSANVGQRPSTRLNDDKLKRYSNRPISLRRRPPTRKEMADSGRQNGLLPMHAVGDAPSWMTHLFSFSNDHRRSNELSSWIPRAQESGKVSICLTRSPPTRATVSSWHRRRAKRARSQSNERGDGYKRQRTGAREVQADLELDGNSRKLVVTASSKQVDFREVEKVEWLESQPDELPASQGSLIGAPVKNRKDASHKPPRPTVTNGVARESTPSETASSSPPTGTPSQDTALGGMGNQGGRLWVEGGGELKAKTRPSQLRNDHTTCSKRETTGRDAQYLPSPVSIMVVEVHVQCRSGSSRAGVKESKKIALTPDSDCDRVFAVAYVHGKDPGGGEPLETIERGCLFVPLDLEVRKEPDGSISRSTLKELSIRVQNDMPKDALGVSAPLSVECLRDERDLLLRIAAIVRRKNPDILLSWDTQGAGLGYLIERGVALGQSKNQHASRAENSSNKCVPSELDLVRLLGRTPTVPSHKPVKTDDDMANAFDVTKQVDRSDQGPTESGKQSKNSRWKGSGLGRDWDDRVGAGAAAASITGRLVFAAWKIVAEEVKHPNVSYLPAVVSSVLGKRIPFHDNLKLTQWYSHSEGKGNRRVFGKERWRVLHHKLVQATASLLLFDALDVIGRSGEAARLSGVEFSQSFPGIRGSQFKVEGVLLRALQSLSSSERGSKKGTRVKMSSNFKSPSLSEESRSQSQSPWKARRGLVDQANSGEPKPLHELNDRSYFFFSPSLQDTNKQEALEVQALTLEPQSGCFSDPVVVCDFTALYPSLIIAYNLCYSTCAGRLEYHSTRAEMLIEGKTTGKLGPFRYSEGRSATTFHHHFRSLKENGKADRAYVAPTGTVYVSESVLKGVLPQVLDEILSTRAMLKKAAKLYKRMVPDLSPSILRQLEARQLALKYVANVTYGYTSATFSGRSAMPLLADTIVECGRRTLTNAINLANSWGRDQQGKWFGCEVIYGDTDSVFVKLPGRSVQEAFLFGEEFCKAVTKSNPPPVCLKLEKVYLGSLMQTKKKYCGMKFESKDQRKPTFEAKGIETIRKDQCALTQKVLRNSLIILFRSGPEAVRSYLHRQWNLIVAGLLPVSDFILTGRVRSRYRGGRVGPVQAVLARRLAEADPGRVVRHKERQSYVIVASPGASFRLRDCVLTPMELLEQWDAYTINSAYYITKHVNAALQRCLGLPPHNVDVNAWYMACPKASRRIHFWPVTRSGNTTHISSYFGSDTCSLCKSKCMGQGSSRAAVCGSCRSDLVDAGQQALSKLNTIQNESLVVARRCQGCNLCFEDASTFAQGRLLRKKKPPSTQVAPTIVSTGLVTPLANCSCIDCDTTYVRHRLREAEIEALAVCEALGVVDD